MSTVLSNLSLYRFIFSVLILLVVPLTSFAEQNVIFTTSFQNFAVISTATGKISKSDPFISVALDHYTMRVNGTHKHPVKIVGYKIGLAVQKNTNGVWDVVRWSDSTNPNITLLPGQTKLIENYKTLIPIDGLSSLKDSWLVLAVEIENNGSNGYTYSHSSKGLF